MKNLNVQLIKGLYIDSDEKFDMQSALESNNDYIPVNLYIENIPEILCNIIINNQVIIPTKEEDLRTINMIYSTNIVELQNLINFIIFSIEEVEVKDKNVLKLLISMQCMFERFCELNLYDDRILEDRKNQIVEISNNEVIENKKPNLIKRMILNKKIRKL